MKKNLILISKFMPLIYIVMCLLCLVSIGWKAGVSYQKDKDLWQCKQAGWAFIDEVFHFPRKDKVTQEYTDKAKEELMWLQSKMATKCIIRIDK